MQEGPKLISWIVLTASIVFVISMNIYHPDDSQSLQQYRSGTVGQTASQSVYIPDHSLYTTTSSDESDEEEDENGNGEDEEGVVTGDTTEICNRYLETCPGEGTPVSPGAVGPDCN